MAPLVTGTLVIGMLVAPGLTPADARPRPAAGARVLLGWAGLNARAPLAHARLSVKGRHGRDITTRVTGLATPRHCGPRVDSRLCTRAGGSFALPIRGTWPTGATVVASGGEVKGRVMPGRWRSRISKPRRFVQVTLGSTVEARLLDRGLARRAAARAADVGLGFPRGADIARSGRLGSVRIGSPAMIRALRHVGFAAAVRAAARAGATGRAARWTKATLTSSRTMRQPRALLTVGGILQGVVNNIGGQGLSYIMSVLGLNSTTNSFNEIKSQLQGLSSQMSQGLSDLSSIQSGITALKNQLIDDTNQLTCNGRISAQEIATNTFAGAPYAQADDAYGLLANIASLAGESVDSQAAALAGPTGYLQQLYMQLGSFDGSANGADSGLWEALSSPSTASSIRSVWATDQVCNAALGGSMNALYTAESQLRTPAYIAWAQGKMSEYATVASVYEAFVSVCGKAPSPRNGTCSGTPVATTTAGLGQQVWSTSLYGDDCVPIAGSTGGGCSVVNYYNALGNFVIDPIPANAAVDMRPGTPLMWTYADVTVNSTTPSVSPDPVLLAADDADAAIFNSTGSWSQATTAAATGWGLPTAAQASALIGTVSSATAVDGTSYSMGVPSGTLPGDWLNGQAGVFPSTSSTTDAACPTATLQISATSSDGLVLNAGQLITQPNAGGPILGWTAGNACTGSSGILTQQTMTEQVCPIALGFDAPWGPYYSMANDQWEPSPQGSGMWAGTFVGFPPSNGNCPSWVQSGNTVGLDLAWWLVPGLVGYAPEYMLEQVWSVSGPASVTALQQVMLDATFVDPGFAQGSSRIFPRNTGCWSSSNMNAWYVAGVGVPTCSGVTIGTPVVRSVTAGERYGYYAGWASGTAATTCAPLDDEDGCPLSGPRGGAGIPV